MLSTHHLKWVLTVILPTITKIYTWSSAVQASGAFYEQHNVSSLIKLNNGQQVTAATRSVPFDRFLFGCRGNSDKKVPPFFFFFFFLGFNLSLVMCEGNTISLC